MPPTDSGDVFQLAGTTLEGRFSIDRVVAEGGFGVVYHAQQAALERPIALKVLKTPSRFNEAAKQQFLAGFAAEAKTIARIAHPNIVHVYDFGVSEMPSGGRSAWMALEWLTGTTFEQELLRRRGRGGRSPSECLAILKPILSALAMVHAAGVAHRDLKPANIMLVQSAEGPSLKLLDFGIAKIMAADETPGSGNTQTRSNQIAFSPGYASPEQISNGRSGPWSDVHAMGLILTEMLTDRAPLEGDETALLFQQILDRVRPTPAKFGVAVGTWEPVLARALAVAPAERYRDAGELLKALEATVTPASQVRISDGILSAPDLASATGDTMAVMLTQRVPMASALTPQQPSRVTTHTPTSGAYPESAPARGARAPIYLAGALVLAVVAGITWRALATRAQTAPAAAIVQRADAVLPATTASPPLPTAPPAASAAPSATPSASPSDSSSAASRSAPSRRAAPRAGATASAPSAKPASSGKIVIE